VRKVTFLAPAEEEMLEAASYYEGQAYGLGREFIVEVQHTVEGIVENPKSGKLIQSDIRRRLVRRFPFGILYHIDPQEIVIITVMHLRRRPGYWADRI